MYYSGSVKLEDKDVYRTNLSMSLNVTDKLPIIVQYELLKDFQKELEMKIGAMDKVYEIYDKSWILGEIQKGDLWN